MRATHNFSGIVRHGDSPEISTPNYQSLKTMVKRRKVQKLRLPNFDARNERIETGAVVTSRRRDCVVLEERGQGECCQWREKGQSWRGNQCSFRSCETDTKR